MFREPDIFNTDPKKHGISLVGETSKRDAVWRRLGELAVAMRQGGVAEVKILDLLRYHTPSQIEMAFKNHPKVHPDAVADLILRGRYGFRAGIKKNRQPPDVRPTLRLMAQERKKEAKCPPVPPARVQELLEQYLDRLR